MGLCLHLHDEPVPAIPGASADATTANLHAALRTSVPRFPHVWIRAEEASGTRRLRCPPVLLQPIRSSPRHDYYPQPYYPQEMMFRGKRAAEDAPTEKPQAPAAKKPEETPKPAAPTTVEPATEAPVTSMPEKMIAQLEAV